MLCDRHRIDVNFSRVRKTMHCDGNADVSNYPLRDSGSLSTSTNTDGIVTGRQSISSFDSDFCDREPSSILVSIGSEQISDQIPSSGSMPSAHSFCSSARTRSAASSAWPASWSARAVADSSAVGATAPSAVYQRNQVILLPRTMPCHRPIVSSKLTQWAGQFSHPLRKQEVGTTPRQPFEITRHPMPITASAANPPPGHQPCRP